MVDGMAPAEAVDHSGDVGLWIETIQLGGLGDGVDDRRAFAAGIGAEGQKVLPRQGDSSQLPLRQIIVDREPAVCEIRSERLPSVERVLRRLAESRFAREAAPLRQQPFV